MRVELVNCQMQVEYAGLNNHLGMFVYYTYTQKDFDDLFKVYSYGGSSAGFYKNNITENAHPQYHVWVYVMVDLYTSKGKYTHISCCITIKENLCAVQL